VRTANYHRRVAFHDVTYWSIRVRRPPAPG